MDDGTIPGTLFAFSPKGWMDTELFENWFFHHFLVYAPPVQPLLLLDGHSSHYSPTFVNSAGVHSTPETSMRKGRRLELSCLATCRLHTRAEI